MRFESLILDTEQSNEAMCAESVIYCNGAMCKESVIYCLNPAEYVESGPGKIVTPARTKPSYTTPTITDRIHGKGKGDEFTGNHRDSFQKHPFKSAISKVRVEHHPNSLKLLLKWKVGEEGAC